jgi:hypothetical protein
MLLQNCWKKYALGDARPDVTPYDGPIVEYDF